MITKISLTDLNYSQPDYLDRDMYTKNSVEPTRPLSITNPKTLQKYRRCLKNIITECIASPTV